MSGELTIAFYAGSAGEPRCSCAGHGSDQLAFASTDAHRPSGRSGEVSPGRRHRQADEAAKQSEEQLVSAAAPIVAPYIIAAVGPAFAGPLAIAAGLLAPALAPAVVKGGDPDP
jgi:hypothetical protein